MAGSEALKDTVIFMVGILNVLLHLLSLFLKIMLILGIVPWKKMILLLPTGLNSKIFLLLNFDLVMHMILLVTS
ncbi:hypothetical protein EDC94DRAFT_632102 [Helicostylum pulchrum]|nr:hypothetical protein EDC94DRAFT_632102 [Helicostylum pulchrum]